MLMAMDDRTHQDSPPLKAAPEQIEVGPGTLRLLSDMAFGAPGVPEVLNAHLLDKGHDPDRKWRLKFTGAVIVADEDALAGVEPARGPA